MALTDELYSPGDHGLSTNSGISQIKSISERKLMAKIDLHLLPCLCILYLLAFLDRVNVSNAAILGLKEDLNLEQGTKFNTALTIFFVPYIFCEIPSNILLKKLKPHVWLSGCMFMFGVVMICQGFVTNWGGLMTTRFFLGVFEAGMFPGCFYLMGMWYRRSEAQKRFSFFFSSTSLAGGFGGLLAYGLSQMGGIRGYSGWRWVFIIEGIITAVVALVLFFLIPDFPEDAKWLNEVERAFIREKLASDVGKSAHQVQMGWSEIATVLKDYKVILGGIMYFGLIVPAYSYAFFAPSIIKSYGYDSVTTQLYSIPPWVASFGFSMIIAFCSDRLKHRFAFTVIPLMIAIAGFAMLFSIHGTDHRTAEYGALFLVTCGAYSAMPVIVCWFAMNLGGHHRRSVGIAWQIGFGNIGGIIATYCFLEKDAPLYKPGYSVCMAFCCLTIAACCAYMAAMWFDNRKRDNSPVDPNAISDEQAEYLGDLAPTYRYQY
ncbi:MFS transporter [Aspergillus pseudocaelatus]|uniref:MFS transporter n=1 Tax=Aspergillus pseudocaelatus TaxID=1825620 RepID=A0ABQ6X2A9_9EURO|nr:MFS transporter [Aspergillus pseudocaelatus]